jgi:hypothetical protein
MKNTIPLKQTKSHLPLPKKLKEDMGKNFQKEKNTINEIAKYQFIIAGKSHVFEVDILELPND